MNDSWNVTQNSQKDVDEEVCPTTALKEYSQGRNENCDKDLGEGMSVEGMEEREEI